MDINEYLELLQNSNSFPLLEKMMRATSASHRTESSYAFFKTPPLLFANVTCLLIVFSILFSSTLPLPIFFFLSYSSLSPFFYIYIYTNKPLSLIFFLFFLFSSVNIHSFVQIYIYTCISHHFSKVH